MKKLNLQNINDEAFRYLSSPLTPVEIRFTYEIKYPKPDPTSRFGYLLSRPYPNFQTFSIFRLETTILEIVMDMTRPKVFVSDVLFYDMPTGVEWTGEYSLSSLLYYLCDSVIEELWYHLSPILKPGWAKWFESASFASENAAKIAATAKPEIDKYLVRQTTRQIKLYRAFSNPSVKPFSLIKNKSLSVQIRKVDDAGYSRQVDLVVDGTHGVLRIPDNCERDSPELSGLDAGEIVEVLKAAEEKGWNEYMFLKAWIGATF
ncbi:MAG: hypothetical protein ACYDBP_07280 [Leptospirales bacterium]